MTSLADSGALAHCLQRCIDISIAKANTKLCIKMKVQERLFIDHVILVGGGAGNSGGTQEPIPRKSLALQKVFVALRYSQNGISAGIIFHRTHQFL